MDQFLTHFTYAGLVLLLMASGLGLPIPEDVPLITAGYLARREVVELAVVLPLALTSVIAADGLLFWLGRRYGQRVLSLRMFRWFVPAHRFDRAKDLFARRGGQVLIVGRFLPGMRAVLLLAAGTLGVPTWKWLVCDGGAAAVSVTLMVLLGWWLAPHIDALLRWEHSAELLLSLAGVVVLIMIVWSMRSRRK